MTGFSQLLTNFTFALIIFGSRNDIKYLNRIHVSTLLKTSWTKFEVIPSQDVRGDTSEVNATLSRQISPIGLAESLLHRAMDLILNLLERSED